MILAVLVGWLALWFGTTARAIPHFPSGRRVIAHWEPYAFNNSLAGNRRTKRRRIRQHDQDFVWTKDTVAVNEHWPKFAKDGYLWLVVGRTRFGRERRELHRWSRDTAWHDIPWHGVGEHLRTAKRGGKKPRTARQAMRVWHLFGIRGMAEWKTDPRDADPEWSKRRAASFRKDQEATGANVSVMTLTLRGWQNRVTAAHEQRFEVVLLAHGDERPADLDRYSEQITYVRGSFRPSR